ncbi:type I restriction-modification system subunit M N-terminal domain-containing protein [Fructilactobacillus cliffordii]|uniref:type I restriction-modification system subunit M N-terminal domain-containing protein n=1 Tax=Fructilactobacillus cliffordii TaxID=2940299 RepID=UPI002092C800|nr:type I restriction-modification system subunit M N-terminal domain-containing protein [Fructilactobacillus cliffordii]USS86145.1 type I restriction-modification system subunit M N-terminal domain-containing protein [Fructilactobacillus cliffordii]
MVLSENKKSLVWKTLNETRGKIEPSEYKNYIFVITFYKYLSDKAQNWVQSIYQGTSWAEIWQKDKQQVAKYMQDNLGYVIQPGDLFSDW